MEKKFVFFGTPEFAVIVLSELKKAGIIPSLIVTSPDKRQGRGMKIFPHKVKIWAEENGIEYIQPEKLDAELKNKLQATSNRLPYDLFVVASYGKIMPKEILDIPEHGTLNVHPSLLPKLRGATPIESAILSGEKVTGVSIMLLDEKLDHGAILKQVTQNVEHGTRASKLEKELAVAGGKLLAEVIPLWVSGKIKATPQEENSATYTKKITKEDGLIDPNGDPETNWRKFLAFYGWPGVYFFTDKDGKKTRIIVKEAEFENGEFIIKRVLPEGGREVDYKNLKSV